VIKDTVQLFYPRVCAVCTKHRPPAGSSICLSCDAELPFALVPEGTQPVEKAFWGRLPLKDAYAWLRFRRDNHARELLHSIKYGGDPELGREVGRRFGRALRELIRAEDRPQALIPVPLHPKKLRARGYNQAAEVARGMGEVLEVEVCEEALIRKHHRSSLTRLSRTDRWEQISNNYAVGTLPSGLSSAMLVDDVITTGATLEVCGKVLIDHGIEQLSVAAVAYAERMF
jgi:ComF family protein